MRLIERWLDKRLVRVSLSGLSPTLIFSLVSLASIDAEADLSDTPPVAARALSPAVNDFYTALAACDRLTTAMLGQTDIWIDDGKVPVYADETRIELPGQDFRVLFDDPLDALRQTACEYPSVSIRMIGNYARLLAALPARCDSADLRAFLTGKARELAEHAADRATAEVDRAAIRERIARFDAAA